MLPRIGLGTYKLAGHECAQAVRAALNVGYRLIDSGALYRNEPFVAQALRASNVQRGDVVITSKLAPKDFDGDEEHMRSCALKSVAMLNVDAIDLYLCNWPGMHGKRARDPAHAPARLAMWKVFRELKSEGKLKAIGVSNFSVDHLRQIMDATGEAPAVNQIEFHPFCQQADLVTFCKENNIEVEAYAPLGQGNKSLHTNEVINKIASSRGMTPAQVILRWISSKGVVPIPKSTDEHRIAENFLAVSSPELELTPAETAQIDALEKGRHFAWDPRQVA